MTDTPNPYLSKMLYNPEKSIQRYLELSGLTREEYEKQLADWHERLNNSR